jgi:hypothetical protein
MTLQRLIPAMHTRIFRTLPIVFAVLLAACGSKKEPALEAEITQLKADLDATRQKLTATERELAEKTDEIAKAAADAFAAEATRKQAVENDKAIGEKDAQIRALQNEVAALKKSDALAFAEASATQQRGVTIIALDRYQQFLKDHPKSPLVPHAERAIAELTTTADKEAKWRATTIDPKRPERDILKRFEDSVVSVDEIAPLLKARDRAEVVKLLGRPHKTFRNNTEFGYVDKVLDPRTGGRETLVIVFTGDRVTALRVGYTGREIKP